MEVLVPHVSIHHWLLFIFIEIVVLHLDSANIHTESIDKEYISRLWKVWQLLHELYLGPQPVMEVVHTFV